jgi:hypothetical protein
LRIGRAQNFPNRRSCAAASLPRRLPLPLLLRRRGVRATADRRLPDSRWCGSGALGAHRATEIKRAVSSRRSSSSASAAFIDSSGPPRSRVASPLVAEAEGTLGVAPTAGAVATQAPTAQALATQAPTAQAVTTQTPTSVSMVRVPPAMAAGLVGPRVPRQRQYRGRPCPAHLRGRILPTVPDTHAQSLPSSYVSTPRPRRTKRLARSTPGQLAAFIQQRIRHVYRRRTTPLPSRTAKSRHQSQLGCDGLDAAHARRLGPRDVGSNSLTPQAVELWCRRITRFTRLLLG